MLARLFARPANVLVLDEPTNDLDIETLELLEQLLQDYDGTLFLVSHDRAFLDNVVTQTIVAEGDGLWREYAGGYEDWLRCRKQQNAEARRKTAAAVPSQSGSGAKAAAAKSAASKLSWKEQRELEGLPDRVAALESEQTTLAKKLEDPATHAGQTPQAAGVVMRLAQIESELLKLLERWEALEAR